jgi:hypothetical protein
MKELEELNVLDLQTEKDLLLSLEPSHHQEEISLILVIDFIKLNLIKLKNLINN